MTVTSGGWVKLILVLGLIALLAGCSVGDLDASAATPDGGSDSFGEDTLDSGTFDGDSVSRDTDIEDAGTLDVSANPGLDAADARADGGADISSSGPDVGPEDVGRGLDALDTRPPEPDAGTPQPDANTPEPDVSQPDPCPRVRITRAAGVDIRTSAQSSASVVGSLTQNSVVVVAAETRGDTVGGSRIWYQIESPLGDGYIPAAYGNCTDAAPHIEPPVEVCPNVKVTSSNGLNIRSAPDGSGYVGGLCQGSIVEVVRAVRGRVVEGDDTWYQIKSPNGNGYITGKYADCTTSSPRLTNC